MNWLLETAAAASCAFPPWPLRESAAHLFPQNIRGQPSADTAAGAAVAPGGASASDAVSGAASGSSVEVDPEAAAEAAQLFISVVRGEGCEMEARAVLRLAQVSQACSIPVFKRQKHCALLCVSLARVLSGV